MTTLVLASASPARLETLQRAGITPLVLVSDVDEDAALAAARNEAAAAGGSLSPADAVLTLARAKAESVAASAPVSEREDALVLGCDSMLELDGEVFGKPASARVAIDRWKAMRGRDGVLHTGHWLIDKRGSSGTAARAGGRGETASTVVRFADLSDQEIAAYVETGEPLRVAGAFTVDGLGGPYVTGVDGDYHNVVGLSLPLLRTLLGSLGLAIHELRSERLL